MPLLKHKTSYKIEKRTWKVHAIAQCQNCGKEWQDYHNAQGVAARHAICYGHTVMGEVALAFEYKPE